MNRRPWYAVLVTVLILGTASVFSSPTAPSPPPSAAPARAGAPVSRLLAPSDVPGLLLSGMLTLWLIHGRMRRRVRPAPVAPARRPPASVRGPAGGPRPRDGTAGLATLARQTGLAQDALRLLSSRGRHGRPGVEGTNCRSGKNDRSAAGDSRSGPTPDLVAALLVSPRLRVSDRPAHGLPLEPSS
jgi:hypothetical protein